MELDISRPRSSALKKTRLLPKAGHYYHHYVGGRSAVYHDIHINRVCAPRRVFKGVARIQRDRAHSNQAVRTSVLVRVGTGWEDEWPSDIDPQGEKGDPSRKERTRLKERASEESEEGTDPRVEGYSRSSEERRRRGPPRRSRQVGRAYGLHA